MFYFCNIGYELLCKSQHHIPMNKNLNRDIFKYRIKKMKESSNNNNNNNP